MSDPSTLPTLVIGESIADLVIDATGQETMRPGGSPANVAVGLARLGRPVHLRTRIGSDPYGAELQRHLHASGVQLDADSLVDGPTATATTKLDDAGSASYSFDIHWEFPGAFAATVRNGLCGHLHTGSIASSLEPGCNQVLDAFEAAQAHMTTSYDPNLRPGLLGEPEDEQPQVESFVAASDLVKVSDEDLSWLYPGEEPTESAQRWTRMGPALVVLTRGRLGASAFWTNGSTDFDAARTSVVDTIGAGDAFMSGLLAGMLQGGLLGGTTPGDPRSARTALHAATAYPRLPRPMEDALLLGRTVAAITCSRAGANPPTRSEVLRFTTDVESAPNLNWM